MKKLVYILILAVIASLTACSNDDNSYSAPDNTEKTYTINFKIKNSSFDVDESNLRSTQANDSIFLRIFFYHEDGSIVKYADTTLYLNNNTSDSFNFTTELALGKYHIAFVGTKNYASLSLIGSVSLTNFYNYYTDYYQMSKWVFTGTIPKEIPYDNENVFYRNVEINVLGDQTTQEENIALNPIWSYLNINILDAKTFDAPEGTEALEFDIKPRFAGFGLANKLATKPYIIDKDLDIISLDSIRMNPTFTYKAALSETDGDNNISINVKYLKKDADSTIILETRELKIAQTTLKNGYNYNINGNLGSKNSGQSMNISLGSFAKDDVNIEF